MENNNTNDIPVNLTDEETINLFVEGLMEEKGIKPESDEVRQDIFMDIKTSLMQEIDRSLVAELPEEKLDELSKKAEAERKLDPEEVANAVAEANLNVEEIVGVTMANFRDLYLAADKPADEPKMADAIDNETGAAETEEA